MKKVLILFLVLCSFSIYSQNKIDSLIIVVEKSAENHKVEPLIELADIYQGINLDSSLLYANRALKLSEKFNDNEHQGQALKKIGIVYYYRGMNDTSFVLFKKSIAFFKKSGNKPQQARLLNNLGIITSDQGNYDKALEYYQEAKDIYVQLEDTAGISGMFVSFGTIYLSVGSYEKALEYFKQANEMAIQSNDEFTIMSSTNNIGLVYHYWGKFEEAIKYYQKSLEYSEQQGDKRTAARIIMNIGIIFYDWGKYDKALEYYKKSEQVQTELNDINGLINTIINIAIIYEKLDNPDTAIIYYRKALEIAKEADNKKSIATAYLNLGAFYSGLKQYAKARTYFFKSLEIRKSIDDKHGIATALSSIGRSFFDENQPEKSLPYYNKSLEIIKELETLDRLKDIYEYLAQAHKKLGNYKQTAEYIELYSKIKDSIFSENTYKQIQELQTKYETEKKEKEIELLNKESLVKDLKVKEQHEALQKQRIAIISFIVVFLLIIVFSIIVYRLYHKIKKANQQLALQNAEINEQKEEILAQNDEIFAKNEALEEKNAEISTQRDEIESQRDLVVLQKEQIEVILDELSQSIDYAKQIQNSILPDVDILLKQQIENFIVFKPKDRVSGDFYWWASVEEHTVIAVSDCTGHGVPGAFMSFLGISFLREIVTKEYVTHPGVILRKLRKDIVKTLAQTGEEGTHKDGMDMSLLVINHKENTVSWAGANNPLWIVRANDDKEYDDPAHKIEEIKPDKMPIGIYTRMDAFVTHDIHLNAGDKIYMFSDGYPDQFGGPDGKKYKSRAFKRLIAKTAEMSIREQGKYLEQELYSWMRYNGKIYPQVDDITVFGAIIK